jgi:Kef-type K+ transport system membrane component KefB
MLLSAGPVAPIGAHQILVLLLQIGLLFGLALLLGRLAQRCGIPAVVGELCAGVLLGPSVLGHAAPGVSGWLLPHEPSQMHLLDAMGQLGVVLLVGITGMNLDLGWILRQGATVVRVSMGGLVVPLGLGVAIGFVLPPALLVTGGDRTVFASFIGLAMCVSAIPVIAKTLLDMRLLHRNIGQLIIGAAAIEDVIGWLLLSIVSAMAQNGVSVGRVAESVAFLTGVILFAVTIARPAVRALLRVSARSTEPGVVIGVVVLLIVFSAAGTQALGLEAILGAFFGGVLIGSSRGVDRARLAPLRTLVMAFLAPLFFATAGLRMDLTALARPEVLGAASLVLLVAVVGKFAGVYAGARTSRLGRWDALALGAGMNSRGVVEVIIGMIGLQLGVLTTGMYTIIMLVAIATSMMAPPLLRYTLARGTGTSPEEMEREKALAVDYRRPADPVDLPSERGR